MQYLHHASLGIGVLGVMVIVFGVIGGLLRFLLAEFLSLRGQNVEEDRRHLRRMLGYYLLLGLEFLIAADIIDTLMKPNVQDLVVLGAIVLIRTVISYSLNVELQSERRTFQPGRITPRAPQPRRHENEAHGVTRPASTFTHRTEEAAERLL